MYEGARVRCTAHLEQAWGLLFVSRFNLSFAVTLLFQPAPTHPSARTYTMGAAGDKIFLRVQRSATSQVFSILEIQNSSSA